MERDGSGRWGMSRAAFDALYPSLRRFAGAVGPWDVEPDDLVQEALARALRGGPLDRLDNPGAYLRRAIINMSSNHFRKRNMRSDADAVYLGDSSTPQVPSYPSDLADLMSLEPAERAVVYLHDVHGYTFVEIAAAIDTPESTCRQIASRARRKLRLTITQEAQP